MYFHGFNPAHAPKISVSLLRLLALFLILTFMTNVDKHNYFVYLPRECSKWFKAWDKIIENMDNNHSFTLNARNYEKALRKRELWRFQQSNSYRIPDKKTKKEVCRNGLAQINIKNAQLESGQLLEEYQERENSFLSHIRDLYEEIEEDKRRVIHEKIMQEISNKTTQ